MTKRRKVLLSISIAGGVLSLSAIILACIVAGVYVLMDESAPKDDDLRVSRLDVPGAENAFHYFNKAANKLYWPEDKEKQILMIVNDEQWDSKFVDKLIEKNAEVFDHFEQGLMCLHFQVPEITGFDTLLPYLSLWRNIARLKSIRVLSLTKHGKEKEAFDEAMKIIKFGHMTENSHGALVNYLVGAAIKDTGLTRLRRMLQETRLEPEILTTYIDKLGEYRASGKGLAYALRLEYMIVSKSIIDLTAGKLKLEDLGGEGTQYPKSLKVGYFFQPNKTKRMFAQTYRVLIENIPRSYVEMEHLELPDRSRRFGTVKLFVSGNAIGKILYKMIIPALGKIQMQKCRENISVSATQLLLAIKCHKNKTGQLPQSLSELVPEYFREIPGDDFDGKAMKYSKQKGIVYTVGEDLKDSGGCERGELWDMEDPSFKIEF